jgi:hypothetical protein
MKIPWLLLATGILLYIDHEELDFASIERSGPLIAAQQLRFAASKSGNLCACQTLVLFLSTAEIHKLMRGVGTGGTGWECLPFSRRASFAASTLSG